MQDLLDRYLIIVSPGDVLSLVALALFMIVCWAVLGVVLVKWATQAAQRLWGRMQARRAK